MAEGHASRARDRAPDLTAELRLMSDDLTTEGRPVRQRIAELIDALEQAHARYAICGAVAMGAHGARRFTEDVDVLIDAEHLEAVVAHLAGTMKEIGRQPEHGAAKQVRLRPRTAVGLEGVDIDFLVPLDAVEEWALTTAVRAIAFDRKVDVVSPEALVVMKLRAYVSDPRSHRGGQHRTDAMRVLALALADVDVLRHFVSSHSDLAAALEEVLAAPPPRDRIG